MAQVSGDEKRVVTLTEDYRCKGCVDSIAAVDESGVLIVRRKPAKPQPEYWLESLPPSAIERIEVRTHISIVGMLGGLVAIGYGSFMLSSVLTSKDAFFHYKTAAYSLLITALGVAYVLGCRRKKVVVHTREEWFMWMSAPLRFRKARAQAEDIRRWCAERNIMVNGRVEQFLPRR